MHTGWYRMDLAALPRGVVAAVATDDAAPLWHGPIASVLEELADKLPAESHPKSRSSATAARTRSRRPPRPLAGGSTRAGRSRYGATRPLPVAGPLLREVLGGPARPVVLITTVPVIDLADWAVPATAGRILVYRLAGADRVSPPPFTELGPDASLTALVDHLRDPVKAVRIGHPAALALDWDNPAYRWDAGALACDAPGTSA